MSERETILENRALAGVMASYSKTLEALEKRSRWPGATQFAPETTKVLTVQLWTTVTWETVTSLTLDPGRWLLIGQGSFAVTNLSGETVITQMRLDGDLEASSREAYVYNSLVSARPFYQIQCVVDSSGETFTLEAACSSTNIFGLYPSFRSAQVEGGSLIAYPL